MALQPHRRQRVDDPPDARSRRDFRPACHRCVVRRRGLRTGVLDLCCSDMRRGDLLGGLRPEGLARACHCRASIVAEDALVGAVSARPGCDGSASGGAADRFARKIGGILKPFYVARSRQLNARPLAGPARIAHLETSICDTPGGSMKDPLNPELLAHVQAVLAQWDIPPLTAIEAVREGHPVFKVTTVGPAFTLKDISDKPNLHRLAFTDSVLRHVARAGLRVPLPLRSRSAQLAVPFRGRFYLLSEFIEAGKYPNEPELQAELFFQTGHAIARLHLALASYPDPAVRRQTWHEDLAGRVAEWISALGVGLPEPQAAVVKRVGRARGAAIATALQGLPEQLIHRDCHPGNILVDETRVIGFIDCDHLCIGPRLFDLAYYAVHHLKWVTDAG
jgi:Ser/Thr protein kinase RdoA (MazF antagonist)